MLESLFNKAAGPLIKQLKETPIQMFSCEICKIFKNTFLYITPPVATSVPYPIFTLKIKNQKFDI